MVGQGGEGRKEPVGRRNIQMWIWRGSYLRVGRVYLLSLAAVERCKQLLPTFLSVSSSLPALFNRETTGFLLFPRRVPLCAADKAPRSRPLPYPPEIFRQYPNERSTEETGWKGTRARKGCIKKGGDARHHDATADNLGRECDAINRPVSNCR